MIMKKILSFLGFVLLTGGVLLTGCALTTVNEESVMQGATEAKVFELSGGVYNYDQVWKAAMSAMGNGMNIIESHRPSGTIKSRMSSASTGKVVGFFIRPTTPTADSYTIEIVSKKPVSLTGLPEATSWEPSVLADFKVALAQSTNQASAETQQGKTNSTSDPKGAVIYQSATGSWYLSQDKANKVCSITFVSSGSSAGYLLTTSDPKASFVLIGPKVPPVSKVIKEKLTLTSVDGVAQTVNALHGPHDNKNGAIVFALTDMQAGMKEITDTDTVNVALNGVNIFTLKWSGGFKARDSMLKCMGEI
jgi:hypothetical protein